MEVKFTFNGVRVVITTGECLSEVQNHLGWAEVIISVNPHGVKILKGGLSNEKS